MFNKQALFFSLIVLNITIGANNWSFLSIHLGQVLYYFILIISFSFAYQTKYKKAALFFLLLSFFFKFLSILIDNVIYDSLGDLFAGLIIVISGSVIYGSDLNNLHKILHYFICFSIPVMIAQKLGISTIFYAWNVELFHVNGLYVFDEVKDLGKIFKDIPLLPTLFVESEDLISPMYQSRPTGLLYSNNVLSFFLCVFLALHFSIDKKYVNLSSYLSISFAAVLTSSFLVFIVYLLLILFFIFKRDYFKRSIKSLFYLILALLINYIFFPGLVENIFSESYFWSKITSRFFNLINSMGFDAVKVLFNLSDGFVNTGYNKEVESFTVLSYFLNLKILIPTLIFLVFVFLEYMKKNRLLKNTFVNFNTTQYSSLLFVLILTQTAILFITSPFFQICLGVALYPIVTKSILKKNK